MTRLHASRRIVRTLLAGSATTLLLAVAPGFARAADAVVVPGADARYMAALDGSLVWVAGAPGSQTLLRRGPDGVILPVAGAPVATYRSIDLGRDATGDLVLTYLRCDRAGTCFAFADDLAGKRTRFRRLAPRGCAVSAAPARWGRRVAFALDCSRPSRSGLFVRAGDGPVRRLRTPPRSENEPAPGTVTAVDLRGATVGAAIDERFAYAFSQTVAGRRLHVAQVGWDSEETAFRVAGLALGVSGTLWTLVDRDGEDERVAGITRLTTRGCARVELLPRPAAGGIQDAYGADALAVDGDVIYLDVPGTGIVAHSFATSPACA